ncbi:MAG TPA: exonuclease domain-containing protein [Verrucomicrobiae bacterium]|jgi:DNA polymerase-3 subunit epsilon|nr:exonuclease domain-containing protein [Verrucomicrobiae bacterium]
MKVSHDLICLDIESTGVWVEKDKIIEIALIRYTPAGTRETYYKRVNPGISIPAVVTKLTGISDADVKNAPFFRQIAQEAFAFIAGADFAGFNIERFDLPLLEREFAEAGLTFEWKERKIYDAQKVFHLNEKRDLTAAYKFYCDKDLAGAHSAMADSEAVLEILAKQVERYGEGQQDLSVLDKFEYNVLSDYYGSERKFCWWNGKLYPMFGKYARKRPLEELVKADPGYLKWILSKDFSDEIKEVVANALKGQFPVKADAATECPPVES